MKTVIVISFALAFAGSAASSGRGRGSVALNMESAPPAPAPAKGVPAVVLSFEIENFNYYDLTKCSDTAQVGGNGADASSKTPDAKGVMDEIKSGAEKVGKDFQNTAKNLGRTIGNVPGVPDLPDPDDTSSQSLLEAGVSVSKCRTFADDFRSAIQGVVSGLIQSPAGHSPAPAAAIAPPLDPAPARLVPLPPAAQAPAAQAPSQAPAQSFLQSYPAAAAAVVAADVQGRSAPAPAAADAPVFVTFKPGHDRKEGGKAIVSECTFTDMPNNGVDDVAVAEDIVKQAVDNGSLNQQVTNAIETSTGINAKLDAFNVGKTIIEQWDVKKCESHVKSIVGEFSKHYTREQVPMALYNECTTFLTKISFSNDYVLDRMDTVVCKKTVAQFAKQWNFGKNANPHDFKLMCLYACEGKFGENAPQCNAEAGDDQPLL